VLGLRRVRPRRPSEAPDATTHSADAPTPATLGGLVVAWITVRTGAGRYLFGSVDRDRQDQALRQVWLARYPAAPPRRPPAHPNSTR
jgi:hypothetical protein